MSLDEIHAAMVNILEFEDAAEMHMEADGLLLDTIKELQQKIKRFESLIDNHGDSIILQNILEAYKNVPKAYHPHSIVIDVGNIVTESGD